MNSRNEFKEIYKEAVIAYADSGMHPTIAAKKIYISPTAIGFRLEKAKEVTGLDPHDFHDLYKLYEMAVKR